jgi:hypothetical protein
MYIIFLVCSYIKSMRVVEFAEILRNSIEEKIKECKWSIHEAHNPIYNQSLAVEIEALEWVQEQLKHMVPKNTSNK